MHMDHNDVKKANNTFDGEEWMGAFQSWMARNEKCIQVAGNFVKKIMFYKDFVKMYIFLTYFTFPVLVGIRLV